MLIAWPLPLVLKSGQVQLYTLIAKLFQHRSRFDSNKARQSTKADALILGKEPLIKPQEPGPEDCCQVSFEVQQP